MWAREFTDPRYEWRRWFSELFGAFLLVVAGGGAPVVDTLSQGGIGRVAAVAAPALTHPLHGCGLEQGAAATAPTSWAAR